MQGRRGTDGRRIRELLGFFLNHQFRKYYRQSINSLPGTSEAAEGSALVFGRRPQEGVKSGEDVGAIDDIFITREGDHTTNSGTVG